MYSLVSSEPPNNIDLHASRAERLNGPERSTLSEPSTVGFQYNTHIFPLHHGCILTNCSEVKCPSRRFGCFMSVESWCAALQSMQLEKLESVALDVIGGKVCASQFITPTRIRLLSSFVQGPNTFLSHGISWRTTSMLYYFPDAIKTGAKRPCHLPNESLSSFSSWPSPSWTPKLKLKSESPMKMPRSPSITVSDDATGRRCPA